MKVLETEWRRSSEESRLALINPPLRGSVAVDLLARRKGQQMKYSSAILLSAIGVAFISGCASNLKVTYHSDPPGAVLYQGQQKFGYTPQAIVYQLSEEDRKRGYKILAGTTVRWASGATAEVTSITADLNKDGLSQQFTFNRPDGVPGREVDVRFALELERLEIMRRQAAAQEEQAAAQRRQAETQEEQTAVQRRKKHSPTNCTSTVIGNTVHTSCD